ncbi:P-loop containing nucleoside triphosphate hydrolase protein [Microdochium trichocladiopsis]|uniref:P-loop containing nucleoside triphosphate hydrolase protein n=1 Tax=Microdochium trichocladiopsis TaxID=1682393 RepID=A0A9P9BWC1_9PEZI|nr:P-loop containing nucleoside triphosphate hydrolase protein [Microdochium trichocladiopsis]KAH7041233.1 P-loop containing nucleoside triphosphate hydrolase protein [Microdochium trichocladiopsis]
MAPIPRFAPAAATPNATAAFFDHSEAKRVNTDDVMIRVLGKQYPNLELLISDQWSVDLLAFAAAGHASCTAVAEENGDENLPSTISFTHYMPPARRMDGNTGGLVDRLAFGKFVYTWNNTEFIMYFSTGSDSAYPPSNRNAFILSPDRNQANLLVLAAGRWMSDIHEQVWVFDQGYWEKDSELFRSFIKASWDDVILDPAMKKAIIDDHNSFFDSRETYAKLMVPWKRGIIYYGPPGNGKTISVKATMRMLYERKPIVNTLYVRSLVSYRGPEFSIQQVFAKAREFAPCYLVLEDLDTIITPAIRSYFLNEVDGLKNNDGIFMIGSTNHLDRLDPGISKRPSRFDRKYLFPDPSLEQRVAYCKFWQRKLHENKDIAFPDKLCDAIAEITDDFSFAYMQEAFVAALLALARKRADNPPSPPSDGNGDGDGEGVTELESRLRRARLAPRVAAKARAGGVVDEAGDDEGWMSVCASDADQDLDELELWVEIKKQIEILREGMDKEN